MRANCQINSPAIALLNIKPITKGMISSSPRNPRDARSSYKVTIVSNPTMPKAATAQNIRATFGRSTFGASTPLVTPTLSPQRLQWLVFCVYSKPQEGQYIHPPLHPGHSKWLVYFIDFGSL